MPGTLPSSFIFDGEDGGIWGWNPGVNLLNATLIVKPLSSDPTTNSVYKGLALASRTPGGPTLYATNFRNGTVDLFDSSFNPVTLAGAFVDPNLPQGYAPFGIATFDNLIYVTYAKQNDQRHDDVAGPGNGFVDEFDTQGKLITRLISHGALNSPWAWRRYRISLGNLVATSCLSGISETARSTPSISIRALLLVP